MIYWVYDTLHENNFVLNNYLILNHIIHIIIYKSNIKVKKITLRVCLHMENKLRNMMKRKLEKEE